MKPETNLIDRRRFYLGSIGVAVILTCLNGCFVPPTANMQSARCMNEKQYRIVPSVTAVEQQDGVTDGPISHERIANDYGVLIGIGTRHNSEFQIRFDRIQFAEESYGYNFTSIGPKFEVVEDVLALLIPVGLYWDGGGISFDTVQLHPGAIFTLPVDKHLDINTAGKLILPLNGDLPRWYVLNLGLALSSDVDRWAVLPELGIAWSSADAGTNLFTYGVSIAFYPRSGE